MWGESLTNSGLSNSKMFFTTLQLYCIYLHWVCKLNTLPSFTKADDFCVACTSMWVSMAPVTHKILFNIPLPAVLWTWGAKNIMENDYSTSNEGRRWRDFTNGFHMTTSHHVVNITSLSLCTAVQSSYPRELLTGIGLMFTYQRLRAKSGKLWINTYFTNYKRRTLSTKSDKHSSCFGQFSNIR